MVKRSCFKIIGIVLICLIPFVLPAQKFNRNNVRCGDNALKHNKYMEAVQWYTLAIDQGCKNYDIYFNRGIAYYKAGYYNSAIDDFYLALTYNENGEKAHLLLGKAMLIKNDLLGIKHLLLGGIEGMAIVKELDLDENGDPLNSFAYTDGVYRSTGSGFFIDPQGYIATNYHVIENSNGFDVFMKCKGNVVRLDAATVIVDKVNDLAIIKITDNHYSSSIIPAIPYKISHKTQDVGTRVFTMGYPEVAQLGEEIKVTDGIINSRSGYLGDVTLYQISAPIQPGNSGGPLFDMDGNIIGVTNAGVEGLQNVGYAIKSQYLTTLVEASPEEIMLPVYGSITDLPFTDKIKNAADFVVIIKVY